MFFKKKSLTNRLLFPLLAVMILQAGIFFAAVLFGGTVTQMKANAVDLLAERTSSRKNELENRMVQSWSNVTRTVDEINEKTEALLQESNLSYADLIVGSAQSNQLLQKISHNVISLMRTNGATGTFVILNGADPAEYPGETIQKKAGLYFRDNDPTSNPVSDYSDLMAEISLPSITQELSISLDTMWKSNFIFSQTNAQEGNLDYFYKPFLAAMENPGIGYRDLGYWSKPIFLNPGDKNDSYSMMTFSVPLLAEDGTPYGVLGVEISVNYLARLLPYTDINKGDQGGYVLAVTQPEGRERTETPAKDSAYSVAVTSGSWANWMLGSKEEIRLSPSGMESLERVTNAEKEAKHVYGCTYPLHLYNSNTPFEKEQWMLIGVSEGDVMFSFANSVQSSLYIALGVSLAVGLIALVVIARLLTRPIQTLARKLKNSDPKKPIQLDKLNIAEIDELSQVIQQLSQQVADSASKLSQILGLAGVPIGAFEYTKGADRILCTEQFFEILQMPVAILGNRYMPTDMVEKIFEGMRSNMETKDDENQLYTYRIPTDFGESSWVRLKVVKDETRVLGVVTDVTQEMQEKKKIEYERDFDVLTNIYNRRAFRRKLKNLFQNPEQLKIAALMMMDLDNLKYINDTYGHDYGDRYIRGAAEVLIGFSNEHTLVARMSGDEFFVFFYGHEEKDSIVIGLQMIQQALQEARIYLPDQSSMQVRASAGVAWYPKDSENYEELIRFADFAMYMVKKNEKGKFLSFDRKEYEQWAYLLNGREELNLLLEQGKVDYHFQPIVDACTGEVFAYEALMRPSSAHIKTPMELLNLARSQSKLAQVERLTWFQSMEDYVDVEEPHASCKIFINSISNQCLDEEARELFEKQYKDYLDRIVLELTEEEQANPNAMKQKLQMIQAWGAQIALDDFGSGYNGEAVLVDLMPDYVKLDMSIGRNVHVDPNRQKLLQSLVSYSKERGIKVIAEGIECREEMETMIANGVDYLQGYYLGRPQPQLQRIPRETEQEIQELFRRYNR